ncbi:MAG: ATP-binding protein [Tunicatimonas sp.]
MDKENISSLLDEASEVVIVTNEQGELIFFNEAAQRFYGPVLESLARSVYTLFESQIHSSLAQFLSDEAIAPPPRPLTINTLAVLHDNTQRPVSLLLSRVSKQEPRLFMLVVEELLPTNNLTDFQEVARRSTDALSVYDDQLQCVFANPAVVDLGADSDRAYLASGGFMGSILEEEQSAIRQSLDGTIAKNQPQITLTYHAEPTNGPRVLISNQVQFVYQSGSVAYLIAREKKRTAAATDELFMLTNPDLTIDYVSSNCFVLLGYTPQEVTQQYTLRDLLHPKDWAKMLTLAEDSGTIGLTMTLPVKHRSEEQLVAKAQINPFFDGQNQLTYTVIRLTNIVKREAEVAAPQAEADAASAPVAALVRAKEAAEQAMKSREEFISTMSHEIRTPLNAIVGIADLLLASDPQADQRKLLETLKFSSDNLSALVNDILSYSKLEAGTVSFDTKPFNLTSFVQSIKLTYQNLANGKGVKFRLLLEDNFPETVVGDVNRLGQILNNLLNNALKFTSEGQIVLGGYVEDLSEDQCTLLFEVADSGVGIAADQLSRVFEPYQQASADTARRYGGTGLGLSIVKTLVERQQGRVTVDSQEGVGTTFRIWLPFKLPTSSEPNTSASLSDYASLGGLRVLYVEDIIPNQLLMEGFANRWDISLDTALDGLIALEKIKQQHYDVILMDIQMPHMDGFEATQQIRDLSDPHYRGIPIIALSASVSEETQHRIRQVGMDDYLPKPLDPQQLHTKLQALLPPPSTAPEPISNRGVRSEAVDKPDFSELYELYSDDEKGYRLVLEQIKLLSEESKPVILEAVQHHNSESFRFAKHKIMSYVRMLKLHAFEKSLSDAKQYLLETKDRDPRDELIERIRFHFDNIMATITQEIEVRTS